MGNGASMDDDAVVQAGDEVPFFFSSTRKVHPPHFGILDRILYLPGTGCLGDPEIVHRGSSTAWGTIRENILHPCISSTVLAYPPLQEEAHAVVYT